MKFLQGVILSAILVEYATASSDSRAQLHYAIDKGILATAVELYHQDKSLGKFGIECVVKKGNPKFIANFVNQTGQANDSTLRELCKKCPKETIETVLGMVNFSQNDLVEVASFQGLICEPEKFVVLVNKIREPESQESVVESSIRQLTLHNHFEPLILFLDALKSKSLLSEHVEDTAFQSAFKHGIDLRRDDLLKCTFDHPAITPEIYADGLIAYEKYTGLLMFQWLLERADQDDLMAVQERIAFRILDPEFRAAIREAFKTAQPGGTRIRDIQRVERVEEIFEELGYFRESEEPVDLIGAYIGIVRPTPRRKAKEAANWINLREVIDRRELETAVVLYKGDKLLHHKGIEYVIEQQFPEFIVSFIRNAYETNGYILDTLCRKGSKETIENVLEKINFSQSDLIVVASEGSVVRHLPKFLMLLNKITTPEGQESVITNGINTLIREKSTECINPMLDALKDKTFRNERLEAIAFQSAFKHGIDLRRDDLLKCTFDHPVITPEIYADGLIAYEKYTGLLMFQWLLERADQDDLMAVQERIAFRILDPEFRAAIREAFKTAQPGGTRIRDIQRVERVEEIFEELGYFRESEEPVDLIGAYMGVDKPTPRRKAKEAANWVRLREVIDRRELETAVVLYKGDKLLHFKGIEYVIENQFPEFIVSFIRNAYETNGHILNTLCRKCSKETVETVLEKVDFSQNDLVEVASSQGPICEPEKFVMLINMIREPESQESVVEKNIRQLILHSRFGHLIPLLDALKDKIFRNERLEVIAIRIVFKEGVKFNREDLLKRTFDHQAITPGLYADALIESEKSWEFSKLTREWLLERADRDDLQAVNENDGYADLIPLFRTAIENAWGIAKPGGTRTRAYDIQSAKKTKEEFMKIEHAVAAISGIAKIIGEYLVGKEDEEMEVEGVLQEQEEDVEMGVVDEEEWGEGEEAELGGGEDEEEEWGSI